jgi:phage shock protein A
MVKQLEAENLKTKAQLAAIRAKLDSLDRRIDRHEAGFQHLAASSAESSEKLRESLREYSSHFINTVYHSLFINLLT